MGRREVAAQRRELGRLGKDEVVITIFVVAVEEGFLALLGGIGGASVVEPDCGGHTEQVLVVASK